MSTKLTLTIDKEVIESAKKFAHMNGKSLSQVVESYLKWVSKPSEENSKKLISPQVKKLVGVLSLPEGFDYKKSLAKAIVKKHAKK